MDESTVKPETQYYTYSPLESGKRSIRLLTLLPAEHQEAEIRCEIQTAEITWKASFDALSYTWGAPGDNSPNPIYLHRLQKLRCSTARVTVCRAACPLG